MVWRFTESWKQKSKSARVFTWGKGAPFTRASPPWDSPRMSLTSRLPVASTSLGRISWAGTHNRRLLNCQKRIIRLGRVMVEPVDLLQLADALARRTEGNPGDAAQAVLAAHAALERRRRVPRARAQAHELDRQHDH